MIANRIGLSVCASSEGTPTASADAPAVMRNERRFGSIRYSFCLLIEVTSIRENGLTDSGQPGQLLTFHPSAGLTYNISITLLFWAGVGRHPDENPEARSISEMLVV